MNQQTTPKRTRKMVENLTSLDRILGSASSAINKEKPYLAALGQLQSHHESS